MDEGPRTFRDHFLSIYQSYVADVAERRAGRATSGLESVSPDGATAQKPKESCGGYCRAI
jgi:hypothetical protein